MGQYYTPIIIKNGNTAELQSFFSHDYNHGLKLMEHSYIKNKFVAAVLSCLEKGDRLIWFGDYTQPADLMINPDQRIGDEIFDACEKEEVNMSNTKIVHDIPWRKYVINITKQEYIDLEAYEKWAPQNEWGFMVHPIPLLTETGNGRGGGDYFSYYSQGALGTWAGDEIYCADELDAEVEEKYRNASRDYLFYEGELSEEQEEKYYNEDED